MYVSVPLHACNAIKLITTGEHDTFKRLMGQRRLLPLTWNHSRGALGYMCTCALRVHRFLSDKLLFQTFLGGP